MTWIAALALAFGQDEVAFQVLEIVGSAEFKEVGPEGKWRPLSKGMTLKRGIAVHTGLKSKILLKFGNSTALTVKSSSIVTLTDGWAKQNTVVGKVHVELGGVRVDVNEKRAEQLDFKVTTPEATASIRGTDLEIDHFNDIHSRARQFRGSFDFENGAGRGMRMDDGFREVASHMMEDMQQYMEHEQEMHLASDNMSNDSTWQTQQNQTTQTLSNDLSAQMSNPGNCLMSGTSTPAVGTANVTSGSYDLVCNAMTDTNFLYQSQSDVFNLTQTAHSMFKLQATVDGDEFYFGDQLIWKLAKTAAGQWEMKNEKTGDRFKFVWQGAGTQWVKQ